MLLRCNVFVDVMFSLLLVHLFWMHSPDLCLVLSLRHFGKIWMKCYGPLIFFNIFSNRNSTKISQSRDSKNIWKWSHMNFAQSNMATPNRNIKYRIHAIHGESRTFICVVSIQMQIRECVQFYLYIYILYPLWNLGCIALYSIQINEKYWQKQMKSIIFLAYIPSKSIQIQ
jgi:hypothetical protein